MDDLAGVGMLQCPAQLLADIQRFLAEEAPMGVEDLDEPVTASSGRIDEDAVSGGADDLADEA